MVTCSNIDGEADSIEIVSEAGSVMSNNTMQALTLIIDPITDSLHNSAITCRVTRDRGTENETVFNQTIPVTVDGKREA